VIDSFLRLIEFLTMARDHRRQRRLDFFDRYVEPAYQAAEAIYRDYHSMLRELRTVTVAADSAHPLVALLDERRQELRPVRDRLRSLIRLRLAEGRATRFEAGILGLLTGAMASVDRPYIQLFAFTGSAAGGDGDLLPKPGHHTVLDILAKATREDASFDHLRDNLLTAIDQKLLGIESAWKNVVAGYAELQQGTLPAARRRRRSKAGSQADIPEIQAWLSRFHDMAESGQYERTAPMVFEQLIDKALPALSLEAQDLRETIHDLKENEANFTADDLIDSLERFEARLDALLADES
jgi:hypothetical protein